MCMASCGQWPAVDSASWLKRPVAGEEMGEVIDSPRVHVQSLSESVSTAQGVKRLGLGLSLTSEYLAV